MNCTEILKARVSPELKLQVKVIADRELLTEAAWLKRLVIREIRTAGVVDEQRRPDGFRRPEGAVRGTGDGNRVYVRLRNEDWLLLGARAEARGMRPATYVSVLTR